MVAVILEEDDEEEQLEPRALEEPTTGDEADDDDVAPIRVRRLRGATGSGVEEALGVVRSDDASIAAVSGGLHPRTLTPIERKAFGRCEREYLKVRSCHATAASATFAICADGSALGPRRDAEAILG